MSSTTEKSFGARLRKAQDLATYITGFTGYAPPRAQETPANFQAFLSTIIATNSLAANSHQQYKVAIDNRHNAIKGSTTSITKLLPQIKGIVEAQYGRKSTEANSVNAIIKTMRTNKVIKTAASSSDVISATAEKSFSQSQQSYGSQTQYFNDLVNTLSQLSGYNPSNNALKVANLNTFSSSITTLNNTVAQKLQPLKSARAMRISQFADLRDRTQRIKQYVKSQYGINSNEYQLIKGL